MRLTKKYKEDYFVNSDNKELTKLDIENDQNSSQIIRNKLGQLEDIEDELGIDLITLFKALKNGIYIKNQSQTKYPLALLRTHYSNNTTRYYVFDDGKEIEIKLNKYGKTWALTKEELL